MEEREEGEGRGDGFLRCGLGTPKDSAIFSNAGMCLTSGARKVLMRQKRRGREASLNEQRREVGGWDASHTSAAAAAAAVASGHGHKLKENPAEGP